MILSHWRTTELLVASIFVFGPTVALSGELEPVSIPIEEFCKLSIADQKAIIVTAFEHRLQHAKNLFVETTRDVNIHTGEHGILGEVVAQGAFRRVQQWRLNGSYRWRLNGSYRMDTETFTRKDGNLVAKSIISSSFDGASGVGRHTIRSVDNTGPASGRIDVVHDTITSDDRYMYWLDGEFPHKEDYLFYNLLLNRESWQIEAPIEGDRVRLISAWTLPWSKVPGERELLLNTSKAFLPLKVSSRFSDVLQNGKPLWRTEDIFVEDSELVGDVWMPTQFEERISTSSVVPTRIAKYEIKVLRIKHGDVSSSDLDVPFSKGMQIVDAIKGETYYVGADEKPLEPVERLFGKDSPTARVYPITAEEPDVGKLRFGYGALLVNLGVVLLVVGYVIWRRYRHPSMK